MYATLEELKIFMHVSCFSSCSATAVELVISYIVLLKRAGSVPSALEPLSTLSQGLLINHYPKSDRVGCQAIIHKASTPRVGCQAFYTV